MENESFVARRTESGDAVDIAKLVKKPTEAIFGRVNAEYIIEKANLAISLASTSKNEILGHMAFLDYPRSDCVGPLQWEQWLKDHYPLPGASPLNSLFVHLFVAKDGYQLGACKEILRCTFMTVPLLQYAIITVTPGTKLVSALEGCFTVLPPLPGTMPALDLYVSHRHQHFPQLHIRLGRVEDSDDLVPIFNEHSRDISQLYGEHFLAEMIESQDNDHRTFVAEVAGRAVGFITCTTEVDLTVLDQCFDLQPFHHLRKPLPGPFKATPTEPLQTTPSEPLKGPSNAIAIQMFCLDDEYEMRSVDFLVQIFSLFVGYDFCILLQPYNLPEFPLLSYFTRATPTVGSTLAQELYIFHRCALLQSFSVRYATAADIPFVEKLTNGLEGNEGILCDLKKYLHASRDPIAEGACPLCAVVGVCAEQVVGVAVVRTEEDIDYIRAHYNIEDFVYFNYHHPSEHGHLHHFVLNPVFSMHSKHFLKELMRLASMDCVYYPLLKERSEQHRPHSLISALPEMVPIRPRRQVEYPIGLGIYAPSSRLHQREAYALYHTNRKLSLESKISVNSRLVVVGASDTAMSFLENLVFCPHLKFNSLTLVSANGMPWGLEDDAYLSLPHSYNCSPYMYSLMGLHARVNVVKATMIAINRSLKYITVEDSNGERSIVQYDLLFLLMGVQYPVPDKASRTYEIFTINDEYEANVFLGWVKKERPKKAVVWGASLCAFTLVQSLLSAGLSGNQICLVLPPGHVPFNNPSVDERVNKVLVELGVTIHRGYILTQGDGNNLLLQGQDGSTLSSVTCEVLICVDKKEVGHRGFKAINDACLVFDERLVISSTNRTNDPFIFAAGPLTKFSRHYRADSWSHANFNSKEVGKKLADIVLSDVDPMAIPRELGCDDQLIPKFSSPTVQCALLPGGLWYLHIEKPNVGERLDIVMERPTYGQVLVTDSAARGYFRLHINQYSQLETITILTSTKPEIFNFQCLYGLHEKYLNNLSSRFSEGLIPDLSSYFCEPWVCAVMHDRFRDLVDEIREQFSSVDGIRYKENIQATLEDHEMYKAQSSIIAKFESSSLRTPVRTRLFNFLHYNSYHLPMYATPDII